jgi:hypothetical protein
MPNTGGQQPTRRRLRNQRQIYERRHQLCLVGKKYEIAMQQHRGANADCIALNCDDEWTGGLAQITNESERLTFSCIASVGLGAEIGNVVSRRKLSPSPWNRTTRTAGSFSARSSPSDMALYMALLSAFFF